MAQGADISMSTTQRNDVRTLFVSREYAEVLREQSLLVLEANADVFEDMSLLDPVSVEGAASVYRDAFAVLDAVGWAADDTAGAVKVPISAGHVDQLRLRRADVAMAIVDDLEVRDEMQSREEIEEIDTEIERFRRTAYVLWEMLLNWRTREEEHEEE
jgi:hypothetical protein